MLSCLRPHTMHAMITLTLSRGDKNPPFYFTSPFLYCKLMSQQVLRASSFVHCTMYKYLTRDVRSNNLFFFQNSEVIIFCVVVSGYNKVKDDSLFSLLNCFVSSGIWKVHHKSHKINIKNKISLSTLNKRRAEGVRRSTCMYIRKVTPPPPPPKMTEESGVLKSTILDFSYTRL